MIRAKNIKGKQGFTIIEVVLVLAVAGLIFMMVFVALPALQRSQRDTQRREDLLRLVTATETYRSVNGGKAPDLTSEAKSEDFISNYLTVNDETFTDPSGTDYNLKNFKVCAKGSCTLTDTNNTFASGDIYVYQYATCNGDDIQYKNGAGSYAFVMKFEGAGRICANT